MIHFQQKFQFCFDISELLSIAQSQHLQKHCQK